MVAKSCTTWDDRKSRNSGINHLWTGAGFRNHPQEFPIFLYQMSFFGIPFLNTHTAISRREQRFFDWHPRGACWVDHQFDLCICEPFLFQSATVHQRQTELDSWKTCPFLNKLSRQETPNSVQEGVEEELEQEKEKCAYRGKRSVKVKRQQQDLFSESLQSSKGLGKTSWTRVCARSL